MAGGEWQVEIHNRLLRGDPTASADLATHLLPELQEYLSRTNPRVRSEVCADAVVDAVMAYLLNPQSFDPSKRSLVGYLRMSALGDLRNRLESEGKRTKRHVGLDDVELSQIARNNWEEAQVIGAQEADAERLRAMVRLKFASPLDQELAVLIIEGERSTEVFSRLLGIEGEPVSEQRKIVKRHKDRIKKHLKDLGGESDALA